MLKCDTLGKGDKTGKRARETISCEQTKVSKKHNATHSTYSKTGQKRKVRYRNGPARATRHFAVSKKSSKKVHVRYKGSHFVTWSVHGV